MSSVSQAEAIERNNYIALTLITAVAYDYILTLPREIDYVWFRKWTWLSLLYMLARYLGLFLAMGYALLTSSFILPGLTVKVSVSLPIYSLWNPRMTYQPEGNAIYLASSWVTPVFFAASELVMILRVYAMWNRSSPILCVLLFTYVPSIILAVVSAGMYGSASYVIVEVPGWSICNYSSVDTSTGFFPFTSFPVAILSIQLLVLATSRTLRQSIDIYKATKQWQPNKYMELFVRDGMLFFILSMLTFTAFIRSAFSTLQSTPMILVQGLSYLYCGPFIPRLVISVRELCDRERHGRSQGIDTGFGVLSQSASGGNTAISTLAFADGIQRDLEMEEDADSFELIGDDAHQV